MSVPKGPKISGPPAKLARGGTQTRIPVRLVPASRQRSVYISDSELDRGAPTSSQATYTPKSVPPSPGSASGASHPPPAPPRQKARPRSTSATPIAGSVPPAPEGAASRAPTSTPVGELRTGRIGEAGTTFEELRETLTAWVGQVAPEQEGIVAEALRRAAFEQGQSCRPVLFLFLYWVLFFFVLGIPRTLILYSATLVLPGVPGQHWGHPCGTTKRQHQEHT